MIIKFSKLTASFLWIPFLLSTSFEIITFSDWIYKYNWERNNISEITNLTIQELDQSAEKIKVYFKDNEEYLNVSILRDNQSLSIFKQKEIDHMTDVKHLIKLVMGFQRISALILILILAIILFGKLKESTINIFRDILLKSSIIWGALLLIFLISIGVNFNKTFLLFHQLVFTNDLWILDPMNDYLIIMFPERFFMEITLFIVLGFLSIHFLCYAFISSIKFFPNYSK